jgi:hypothetical protein
VALEDGELMPEGENLRLELETRPTGGPEGGAQSDDQRGHPGRERYQPPAQICNGDSTCRILATDSRSGSAVADNMHFFFKAL